MSILSITMNLAFFKYKKFVILRDVLGMKSRFLIIIHFYLLLWDVTLKINKEKLRVKATTE